MAKNPKKQKALDGFLSWRQKNYPDSTLHKCWKLILELRAEKSRLPWVKKFGYSTLYREMKSRGLIGEFSEPKDDFVSDDQDTGEDEDVVLANTMLQRKVQKLQDTNRIERKGWREDSRVVNAMEAYNKALTSELKKVDLGAFTIRHESLNSNPIGIVNISDLHLNELVSLSHNKYDFKVASKRLKLLAIKAKMFFKSVGINQILIAMTGDLLNSNRRVDELLNQATNRAKASLLAVYLLEQFIVDLNQQFNVTVLSVSGNESRIEKDWGWTENTASDNFDVTIFNTLKYVFRNSQGIMFIDGDIVEQVVNVNGTNILFTHGMQIGSDIEKSVQQLKGKYSSQGISIDYIMFGHVHSARVGDTYARCSSMVGANAYSDKGLNLDSRASQNLVIIYPDYNRDGIKVDLQNIDNVEGYDIIEQLEAYDAKSAGKLKTNHVILQITV